MLSKHGGNFWPLNQEIQIKVPRKKSFSVVIISSLSEETFGSIMVKEHLVYTNFIVQCTVAVSAELADWNSVATKWVIYFEQFKPIIWHRKFLPTIKKKRKLTWKKSNQPQVLKF